MDAEKKEKGLALIQDIKAKLDQLYTEGLCEDFFINTEAGAIETGLQRMEAELRKKQ